MHIHTQKHHQQGEFKNRSHPPPIQLLAKAEQE